MIQSIVGKRLDSKIVDGESLEIKRQFMDSSLLTETTGWNAKRKMLDSMNETVAWYLENL